jgi:hypothetical protein
VVLLDQDPVVTEAASKKVGPSDVVLQRDWELEARFASVGWHVKEWIVLQSTLNAAHEDHLKVWLGVQCGGQFAERIESNRERPLAQVKMGGAVSMAR